MSAPIVLLTDFGSDDTYVGIMKGVIHSLAPKSHIIDLTHSIPAGNVFHAAYTLLNSYKHFPAGSIFLCVVDPGVGTPRSAIAMRSEKYYFIGPDNGLFTYISENIDIPEIVKLENKKFQLPHQSNTFHGRDIFAPAAAHIASGIELYQLGSQISKIQQIDLPRLVHESKNKISGEIVHIDRFGNAITSIGKLNWMQDGRFLLTPISRRRTAIAFDLTKATYSLQEDVILKFVNTYQDIPDNTCAILLGSNGFLEIAANNTSAAKLANLRIGDRVFISL